MLINDISLTISGKLGGRQTPSGWSTTNCPMCLKNGQSRPDTRKRGGFKISDSTISYHCFNCGYKASYKQGKVLTTKFVDLLHALNVDSDEIKKFKVLSLKQKEISTILEEKQTFVKLEFDKRSLPESSSLVSDQYPEHIAYLHNRGFIDTSDFYVSDSNRANLNRRVIIPYRWKDKIVGWTARHIDKDLPESVPKYYTDKQPNFLYNLNSLYNKERKFTLITEGPFDAMSVDCLALCGVYCNKQQAQYLNTFKTEKIIVPDRDVAGKRLVEHATRNGWSVSFPEWKYKDLNDAVLHLGKHYVVKKLIENRISSKVKIEILKNRYFEKL